MLKSLASLLMKKPEETPPPPVTLIDAGAPEPRLTVRDDHAPIYQSLAMTEEMREALFPTTPQMVSTIFERKENPAANEPPPAAPRALAREEALYPIV